MLPPIQAHITLNAPVRCSGPECSNLIDNRPQAIFVVRHLMVVAYCCPNCYLDAWRRQLIKEDPYRNREQVLDKLGYYEE